MDRGPDRVLGPDPGGVRVTCFTHHHACDCREQHFREVEAQRDQLAGIIRGVAEGFRLVGQHGEADGLIALADL